MKKTTASAAAPKVHVTELQRRTLDARKRAEAAKKQARDAKQRAREARRLFKEAKRVARKAREELATFSKKLKKLMSDKLRGRGAKDTDKAADAGKPVKKKPLASKRDKARTPAAAKTVAKQAAANKVAPKKARPKVAVKSAPKPQPKPVASKRRPATKAKRSRKAKDAVANQVAASPSDESSSDAGSQQRAEESTT
jgi:histone H1/5